MKAASEKLTQVAMKVGEAMYKAEAQAGAAQPGGESAAPNGEKVVDADFEDVDDKNKSA